jgi:signal transduction histidine kinase
LTLPLPSPSPVDAASEPPADARADRLAAELLQAGQELARAHRELEALRERVRCEAAERSELLDAVSHELRTPLTVIGGYQRLLLREEVGPLNEEQRKFLAESQRSCQRLEDFVARALSASQGAFGEGALELGRAPLAPLFEAVAQMFARRLAERGLRLTVALGPDAAFARCDPPRVEQLLVNLVDNAVKHTRAGGVIAITTRAISLPEHPWVRRWVEICVCDEGPGIPREHRERVFEPYVQLAPGRRAGGIGLGLAICRRIVAAHGGAIGLAEREGGGSCFSFTLPAEPPAEEPT